MMNEDRPGDVELDLCGLKCPLPAMKVARALVRLPPGRRLLARATDPLSEIDIPHAVARAGGRVVSSAREGRIFVFAIEK